MGQRVCILVVLMFLAGSTGQNLTWWQSSIIYQLYPRSFMDSNGDGVGDLKGIISKLDYFNDIGVDSFWLSPVYQSPMRDFGYDISNYTNIDPIFGTLADFDELINKSHEKGLKVIMDYVPGHTSTDHPWFNKSVNREGNYTTYYIWDNGTFSPNNTRLPPNNWLSVFGHSAWKWNDIRQQWYYHAFLETQGDLNYRDPNVQMEMKNVLRFWLEKGVDGFRVDAIEKLYEAQNMSLNEPPSGLPNVPPEQYEYLNHIYTSNLNETNPTVADWYKVLEEFKAKDGKDRYMVIELYAEPAVRNRLYDTGGSPFNFDLIDFSPNATGYDLLNLTRREYDTLPAGRWPNFVLGNHDRRRVSHKFGPQYVDLYNMLLLTLWGTPTTYYGEEIGMLEGIISWNQTIDPWGRSYGEARYEEFSRDPERTPMQWTSGFQAGFTTSNTTWLPLGQNYTTINVETEKNASKSSIKLYTYLAKLRKKPAFQSTNFTVAYVSTNVFSYIREGGGERYIVALNIGKMNETVNLSSYVMMNQTITIVAATPGSVETGRNMSSITLNPGDGIVFMNGSVTPNDTSSTTVAVPAGVTSPNDTSSTTVAVPAGVTSTTPGAAPGLRSTLLSWWLSIAHASLVLSLFTWLPLRSTNA